MNNFFAKIGVVTLITLALGCSQANNKPLSIHFTPDSTAFEVNHIDPAGLLQLQQLEEGDSRQREWLWVSASGKRLEGKLVLKNKALYFYPKEPLQRGTRYTVSTFLNSSFGSPSQVLKGKVNYQVRPKQQQLVR